MKSYYYGHQSILAETDQTGTDTTDRITFSAKQQPTQQPPFYGHYTGQPQVKNWRILLVAKFYCPHALAEGNQRTGICEKTLEFSSTALTTLSRYHLPPPLKRSVMT